MSNFLSLDPARDFRVERVNGDRPKPEFVFSVPIPPSAVDLPPNDDNPNIHKSPSYMAWRKEAGWAVKRGHMRSFGGPVTVEILIPKDRAHSVENTLRAVFDLMESIGIVQQLRHINDCRVQRSAYADVWVTVKAA